MNKPEATHDFMTVESFSQLPFNRPPPIPSPSSYSSSSAIRLFGIDVPHEESRNPNPKESTTSNVTVTAVDPVRKFECHYCCRNFPSSQALGGHQNAHKRERQHAKRAYLQTTIAAHHYRLQYPAPPPRLGLGSPSQPITGSPLPGLWRIPHSFVHHDRPVIVQPMFRLDGGGNNGNFGGGISSSSNASSSTSLSSSNRVKENVSLDLHL